MPETQAEAVSQLVEARTGAAADAALAGLSGGLAACVAAMRADAIDLLVRLRLRLRHEALPPAVSEPPSQSAQPAKGHSGQARGVELIGPVEGR